MDEFVHVVTSDVPRSRAAIGHVYTHPVTGGGGGGSSNFFPILLNSGGTMTSMIGLVLGNSSKAIEIFKYFAVTGDPELNMDEAAADNRLASLAANLFTTDDFHPNAFNIDPSTGYLELFDLMAYLNESYQTVLGEYNRTHLNAGVRGIVSCCVTGNFAVRPHWAKKTGTGSSESGTGGVEAVQYYLNWLDFGTEAQLATWDGEKYLCDYDENGEMRETPVVKRVYTSECPNDAHGED